jgi:tetratricopeptide (TPR) repeat protein
MSQNDGSNGFDETGEVRIPSFGQVPWEAEESFNDLLDSWEGNNASDREYEQGLTSLIALNPTFVDAYHHLAILLDRRGDKQEALLMWSLAVNIGLQQIVSAIDIKGIGFDRPFMRAYHGLALKHRAEGRLQLALEMFQTMLKLNPNDNQGARALAINCCLRMKKYVDALAICENYKEDTLPDVLFGRVLSLYALNRHGNAREALHFAHKIRPLVTRELLKAKHRPPKYLTDGYSTSGGKDEAWYYWEESGHCWLETPGAINFVKSLLK